MWYNICGGDEMRRTQIKPHLTLTEVKKRKDLSQKVWQLKRWQVIYFRLTEQDWDADKISTVLGIKKNTVFQWVWQYNKFGAKAYELKGRGGRRNALMSEEQERNILKKVKDKAEKGKIITAQLIREVVETHLKRSVSKDYAYDLLHRNKWSKTMPRPHHPKRNVEAQEAFKKTSVSCWTPQ